MTMPPSLSCIRRLTAQREGRERKRGEYWTSYARSKGDKRGAGRDASGREGGRRRDSRVSTKDPMQQKKPARKALKGKEPTRKAYTNWMTAVASAQRQNRSSNCNQGVIVGQRAPGGHPAR